MADYTSTHTGAEIDAGITKTETLSGTNTGDDPGGQVDSITAGDNITVSGTPIVPIVSSPNSVQSDTTIDAGASAVQNMVSCTIAEYNASSKDINTFYVIVG